jgi:hypothetical protein
MQVQNCKNAKFLLMKYFYQKSFVKNGEQTKKQLYFDIFS